MKIKNKKKFITRILEIIIFLVTIVLTPIAINYANSLRGYKAYGGEYLVSLLGLLVIMIIEIIYEESEKKNENRKSNKRRN